MAKYADTIKEMLGLSFIEPVKKIEGGCNGENWVFSTNQGNIFVKISDEEDVSPSIKIFRPIWDFC